MSRCTVQPRVFQIEHHRTALAPPPNLTLQRALPAAADTRQHQSMSSAPRAPVGPNVPRYLPIGSPDRGRGDENGRQCFPEQHLRRLHVETLVCNCKEQKCQWYVGNRCRLTRPGGGLDTDQAYTSTTGPQAVRPRAEADGPEEQP